VNIKVIARSPIGSGNDERLPIKVESHVTDEAFIENSVDGAAIVYATLGFTDHTGA
jgi:hypothetical protein